MFKNMLKRAWLSTTRKFGRSAILILILFVMANLLLATIAIRNSVNASMESAEEALAGIVYLSVDADAMQKQIEEAREGGGEINISMPTITEALAQAVANSRYLKDYTYGLSLTANASGFDVVETEQNAREREWQGALDDARGQMENMERDYNSARDSFNESMRGSGSQPGGGMRSSGGSMPSFNFSMSMNISDPALSRGDMEIQGINAFDFVSGVESGDISIVDGVGFSEDASGVVISQELAEANGLSIGSVVKLKRMGDSAEVEFEVVGIYKATTEGFNYNTLYMGIADAKELYTEKQLESLVVNNVKYYLASASDKEAFLSEQVEKLGEELDGLKLDVDDSSYQTMVGPIASVGSFASVMMWVVIVAAVVIITLIVMINVRDRRYEMGVLMSLGATRRNVFGQIFVELLIVGTVGFLASIGTGQLIAGSMADTMLASEVASSEEESVSETSILGGPTNVRGVNAGRRMIPFGAATSNAKPIEKINVNAGLMDYLILFGVGYLILMIAMVGPTINILRYQPKTILSGKE